MDEWTIGRPWAILIAAAQEGLTLDLAKGLHFCFLYQHVCASLQEDKPLIKIYFLDISMQKD